MRERGTHDAHVKLQGKRHICRKQSASEDEGIILETRNRSADDLWLLLLCRFHQSLVMAYSAATCAWVCTFMLTSWEGDSVSSSMPQLFTHS